MKKFTYLFLAGLFSFAVFSVNAQVLRFNPDQQKPARVAPSSLRACKSDEVMQKLFETDPLAKARYLRSQQMLDEKVKLILANPEAARQLRTNAIITIPVVVHIMYANPNQVTNAVAQAQIDSLNFYYGGSPFNSDSIRVYTPFRTSYGRTQIRFCMAQRTPADLPTNGITRTTTASTYTAGGTHPNSVVPAWNTLKYLNFWVVNFTDGTLGYAYFPGSFAPGDGRYGMVCDYRAFGAGGGSYMYPEYNLGKTAVHEIGHYLNLPHPFQGGCSPGDGISDTPPTPSPTFGCPSSPQLGAGCSTTPPGIMFQNHMDYADDACMYLFTIEQCLRMETALNTSPDRSPLSTSNGCVAPPPAAGNDAAISAIVTPSNNSSTACASVTPVVTIQNLGNNTLTSATINIRLNGAAVGTQAWTGSLTQGSTADVTLAPLTLVVGVNTIKVHTTNPNGLVDAVPANDTSTAVVTRVAPATIPLSHNFETVFLPPGWSLVNPNANVTWGWYTPGAGGTGTGTAIDNFNFDLVGQTDDIRTTAINTSTGLLANDSLLVTWDLAHKNYPDPGFYDKLQVLATNNCGASFTLIWEKIGPALATAGSSTAFYTTPVAADWVKQRAAIGQNIFGAGQVQFVFRNVNGFGNVVWLDNINVDVKPRKDMQVTAIVRPAATECVPPFAPSITVRNNGGETVTAFKAGYILNGGTPVIQSYNITLATGASTTVSFPNITPAAGTHTIKMFVADPITVSPGPDGTPANDTLTRSFIVPVTVTNVVQGFEGTTFVPSNWLLLNPNNNATWVRRAPGKTSGFSAFIDNYNNNTIGQLDMFQAPPVNTIAADSVIITFDVAHKNYPGSVDRLRVLVSTNCGTTFTAVYTKSGPTLATAGSSDQDFTAPLESEWRTETIRLNNTFTGGNILVQWENTNDFGNNIFVDNINIAPKFKRDLEVLSASPEIACSTSFTPTATIRNRGTETVTGYTISYTVGAGAPVTQVITGINLAPNATTTVTLGAGALVIGANSIKVYTSAPVTASGTGDQYLVNDTLSKTISATGTVSAPLVETFEGTTFAPAGWAVSNPDGGTTTWARAGTGKNSTGSAYIRNFGYLQQGQKDLLYSPVINFSGVDSINVTFDLSAATRDYPGSTTIPMDTLEVLITKDCGNTFTSVYKKWGSQLQTINDPNNPLTDEFVPNAYYLWRTETINLTGLAPNGPAQLVFRNTTNNQNNIFIDNVNFNTRTLPPRLKVEGFMVLPTPFTDQFNVWFVQAPADLRYVTVLNTAGQLIYNKVFSSGSTSNMINVNLANKSAGMYILNLGFSDSSKDKQIRILKTN